MVQELTYQSKFTGAEIDARLKAVENAVMTIEQTLSESQKAQARENIDVVGGGEVANLIKFMRNEKMRREYLTFTGTEDGGTLRLVVNGDEDSDFMDDNILVSKNGGEWGSVHFAGDGEYTLATFNRGDVIRVKGDGVFSARYSDDMGEDAYFSFSSDKKMEISGNVMSVYYNDDFVDKFSVADGSVEGLDDDYWMQCGHMFEGGENFNINPIRPLVLPATTLASSCYHSMFIGCTGLTSAPELPATTLADYCYRSMFSGCTGLNYVKCLATNISASNSHKDWLKDVAATGTFVKAAGMSSWPTGADGIPSGWTVEDAA